MWGLVLEVNTFCHITLHGGAEIKQAFHCENSASERPRKTFNEWRKLSKWEWVGRLRVGAYTVELADGCEQNLLEAVRETIMRQSPWIS